ncbi:MAG: class I SAM-dependent methyltransferase [Cellulosilyticaceae bacterium]
MKKLEIQKQFDKVAESYDFVASLTEEPDQRILECLPKRLNRALDIGCGSGNNGLFLAKHFNEVIGIDISSQFISLANEKKRDAQIENVAFMKMDAENINIPIQFDMIHSRTTFHHLDVEKVVEKCIALLNPGGVLYIKDNVSETPTPPTYVYVVGAILDFVPRWKKYGFSNAWRIFQHEVSRDWLGHLATDRYLSEQEYEALYTKILPGCELVREGWAMHVIWKKPH